MSQNREKQNRMIREIADHMRGRGVDEKIISTRWYRLQESPYCIVLDAHRKGDEKMKFRGQITYWNETGRQRRTVYPTS